MIGRDFLSRVYLKAPSCGTGMKGARAERRKNNQMLKQVQHDMTVRFWSSRTCFGISLLGLRGWALKPALRAGVFTSGSNHLQIPSDGKGGEK